ncbi:MAG TPA: hypothetical protein VME63_01545 [Dyella sp.]|uniref:hypothetical protein n=1 Tax=Dyella sp. TaxID=1869338 RepID=UPI002CD6AC5C|nr:hypothetical protein [Dyella sp.]HTV84059.1 hypothetical protein [Dyella sp.]
MLDFLHEDLVFVTFHVDVADGVGSEGALGDIALGLTGDADIGGCWHDVTALSSPRTSWRAVPSMADDNGAVSNRRANMAQSRPCLYLSIT